jgi:hypothetical protein
MPRLRWRPGLRCTLAAAACALPACGATTKSLDGPSITYVLAIQGEGGNEDAGCITVVEKTLDQDSTTFSAIGELVNDQCVLAMADVDGKPNFIAGRGVDVALSTPDSDGDSIAHSTSTAEDDVRDGTFPLTVFQRDGLGKADQLVWSGKLFVGQLDPQAGIARLGAE